MKPPDEFIPGLWLAQSRFFATNSGAWVSNRHLVLIDPGMTPDEISAWQMLARVHGWSPDWVILTHGHWDHVLGAASFTSARIVAQAEYPHLLARESPELCRQVVSWQHLNNMSEKPPFRPPSAEMTFEQNMTLHLDGVNLRCLSAPGHTVDGLVIHEPAAGVLWAGDMLSNLEIPFVSHSLRAYRQTLSMLALMDIHVLIPGHGDPTREAPEIRARIENDQAYLAALEERVSEAVNAGCSAEETVARCTDISFRQDAEENAGPHRANVESAFLELGGAGDPAHLGWHAQE
jgi:glyoxylase-like metal-dependent hydrolase (beta-lactamase superfamily II)